MPAGNWIGPFCEFWCCTNKITVIELSLSKGDIYIKGKLVDLAKEKVIEDTSLYTKYQLQSGPTTIFLTKRKDSNSISVVTSRPMPAKETEKKDEMQAKTKQDVGKNIPEIQQNMKIFQEQLNEGIENLY